MAKKKVFSIGNALSQGLEETIESAQNYSGELRIDVIPLRKIELDPENPRELALTLDDAFNGIVANDHDKERKVAELASLESLANSIKTQGIINPVLVYKFGESYRLIAGERRTLASIVSGKTDIQAKILDEKPEPLKISLLQWIENIERSDLSLWERLMNLDKIVEAYAKNQGLPQEQVTVTELAELIGCSKAQAVQYKAVLDADTEMRILISDNKIRNLDKAAFILGITSKEQRKSAIDACVAGASLKELKRISEAKPEKVITLKPVERRGRQSTIVKFGATKNLAVAKTIIEAIINHDALAPTFASFNNIDWEDTRSVAESFKQILKTLEKRHR